MNKKLIDTLEYLIRKGEDINDDSEYQAWSHRVGNYLQTAMGLSEYKVFMRLQEVTSPEVGPYEMLSSQLGYLDGLIARAADEKEKDNSSDIYKPSIITAATESGKVFVVHGHDNGARNTVARYLEQLGLTPIILHERASGGRTIIEKFEVYSDVPFAVVLLTPDDVGASGNKQEQLQNRARQNVIMELGYFMGRLGRGNVCTLYKGAIELPSDIQGVIYVPLDEGGEWKKKLLQELTEAKMPVNV